MGLRIFSKFRLPAFFVLKEKRLTLSIFLLKEWHIYSVIVYMMGKKVITFFGDSEMS
jgi:hypothetical protein